MIAVTIDKALLERLIAAADDIAEQHGNYRDSHDADEDPEGWRFAEDAATEYSDVRAELEAQLRKPEDQDDEFAKLFFSPKYGQILVRKDTNAEQGYNPCLVFHVTNNVGAAQMIVNMKDDSDASWEYRDKLFNEVTLERAEGIVQKVAEMGR